MKFFVKTPRFAVIFCLAVIFFVIVALAYFGQQWEKTGEKIPNLKYLFDPAYCEKDGDCAVSSDNCKFVNRFHYRKRQRGQGQCGWIVRDVHCRDNRCHGF